VEWNLWKRDNTKIDLKLFFAKKAIQFSSNWRIGSSTEHHFVITPINNDKAKGFVYATGPVAKSNSLPYLMVPLDNREIQDIFKQNDLPNIKVRHITIYPHYHFEFDIIPMELLKGWNRLINFYFDKWNWYPNLGGRVPGIWFYPNSFRLHIRTGGKKDNLYNDGFDPSTILEKNKKYKVIVHFANTKLVIKIFSYSENKFIFDSSNNPYITTHVFYKNMKGKLFVENNNTVKINNIYYKKVNADLNADADINGVNNANINTNLNINNDIFNIENNSTNSTNSTNSIFSNNETIKKMEEDASNCNLEINYDKDSKKCYCKIEGKNINNNPNEPNKELTITENDVECKKRCDETSKCSEIKYNKVIKLDEERLLLQFEKILDKLNLLENDISLSETNVENSLNNITNITKEIEREKELNSDDIILNETNVENSLNNITNITKEIKRKKELNSNLDKLNKLELNLKEQTIIKNEFEIDLKYYYSQLISLLNDIHKIKYEFLKNYYKKIVKIGTESKKINELDIKITSILDKYKKIFKEKKPDKNGCYYFIDDCPLQNENKNLYNWKLDRLSKNKITSDIECNKMKEEYNKICGTDTTDMYFVNLESVIKHNPSNDIGECNSNNKCQGQSENNYCIGLEQSPGDGGCNKYCEGTGGKYYRSDLEGCVKNYCVNPTEKACSNTWFKSQCITECNELELNNIVTKDNNKELIKNLKIFFDKSNIILDSIDKIIEDTDERFNLFETQSNNLMELFKIKIGNTDIQNYIKLFNIKYFSEYFGEEKKIEINKYFNKHNINFITLSSQIKRSIKIREEYIKMKKKILKKEKELAKIRGSYKAIPGWSKRVDTLYSAVKTPCNIEEFRLKGILDHENGYYWDPLENNTGWCKIINKENLEKIIEDYNNNNWTGNNRGITYIPLSFFANKNNCILEKIPLNYNGTITSDNIIFNNNFIPISENFTPKLTDMSFTIEFWAKFNLTNSIKYIYWQTNNNNKNKYGDNLTIYLYNDNNFYLDFYGASMSVNLESIILKNENQEKYDSKKWNHYAFTFLKKQSSNEKAGKIYINGILQDINYNDTENIFTLGSIANSTVYIGSTNKSSDFFDGSLKKFKLYNEVKSEFYIKSSSKNPNFNELCSNDVLLYIPMNLKDRYIYYRTSHDDNIKLKSGNFGNISGNDYCKGNFKGWSANKCISMSANNGETVACDIVPGKKDKVTWTAKCSDIPPQKLKPGNNGTVNGKQFCEAHNVPSTEHWGQWRSKCISMTSNDPNNPEVIDCNILPGEYKKSVYAKLEGDYKYNLEAAKKVCKDSGYQLCNKQQVIDHGGNLCNSSWTSDAGRGWWVDVNKGDGCGHKGWNQWVPGDEIGGAHCCTKPIKVGWTATCEPPIDFEKKHTEKKSLVGGSQKKLDHLPSGHAPDSTVNLDKHNIDCSNDGFINQFQLQSLQNDRKKPTDVKYNYKCINNNNFENNNLTNYNTGFNDDGKGHSIFLDRHNIDCKEGLLTQFQLKRETDKNGIPFDSNRNDGIGYGRYRYDYKCNNEVIPSNCTKHNTGFNLEGTGNPVYLDRHNINCPTDKKLKRFKLNREVKNNKITGKFRYDYTCCDDNFYGLNNAKLVRHITGQSPTFHPADDNLTGISEYGNANDLNNNFSIKYIDLPFTHFLFISGDRKNWAIIRKNEVQKCGNPGFMRIELSSISNKPYKVSMYNRKGFKEDPWISLEDHSSSIVNKTLLYGEDNSNGKGFPPNHIVPHLKSYTEHNGLSVYIGVYKKDSDYVIKNNNNVIKDKCYEYLENSYYGLSNSKIVRHLSVNSTTFNPINDRLEGVKEYGTPNDFNNNFSIKFNHLPFTHFLFISGDKKNWAIIRKHEVRKCGGPGFIRIECSNKNNNPYKVLAWNRAGNKEDPWFGISDHDNSVHEFTLVYGEGNYPGNNIHGNSYKKHNGLSVYIGVLEKDIDYVAQNNNNKLPKYCFEQLQSPYFKGLYKPKLVRHVTKLSPTFHPANDNLEGTSVYGIPNNLNNNFSIKYNHIPFTHFLFISGDEQIWAILRKDEVRKCGNNEFIRIEVSSLNHKPHQVRMYNRKGTREDPWISLQDHFTSINNFTLLYGEANFSGNHTHGKSYKNHNGLSVYIGIYTPDDKWHHNWHYNYINMQDKCYTNMPTYKNNTYIQPGTDDCPGNDIQVENNTSLEQCKKICDNLGDICKGISYSANQKRCVPKNKLCYPNKNNYNVKDDHIKYEKIYLNKPSFELGPIGMHPWGSASSKFFHTNAKWIWCHANADKSSPVSGATFTYKYLSGLDINATMFINIDNIGTIYLTNNEYSRFKIADYGGGWGGDTGKFTIKLKKGENKIEIYATNGGINANPAGIVCSVFTENNNLLFNTDKNWTYNKNAIELGPLGMKPWGGSSNKYFHKDTKWIWNTYQAQKNAPSGIGGTLFIYLYFCEVKAGMNAKINLVVDNESHVFINAKKIGQANGGWGQNDGSISFRFKFNYGTNIIAINAGNSGGPAGFISTIYDNNDKPIIWTNKDWIYL
jgi:hypothetical protein